MSYEQMVRWLLAFSVIAVLAGPVIILMGAFSASAIFIGGIMLIMGAIGLYAGMRALKREGESAE